MRNAKAIVTRHNHMLVQIPFQTLQGSILGPILFNVSINALEGAVKSVPINSVISAKLGGFRRIAIKYSAALIN